MTGLLALLASCCPAAKSTFCGRTSLFPRRSKALNPLLLPVGRPGKIFVISINRRYLGLLVRAASNNRGGLRLQGEASGSAGEESMVSGAAHLTLPPSGFA